MFLVCWLVFGIVGGFGRRLCRIVVGNVGVGVLWCLCVVLD